MNGTPLPKEWDNLTPDEQDMLRQINRGATALMSATRVDHMIARGLVERRTSGIGLSPAGRGILEKMAAAARVVAARRKREA